VTVLVPVPPGVTVARSAEAVTNGAGQAFDLWFESGDGVAHRPGRPATRPMPGTAPAGWTGSAGPGLAPGGRAPVCRCSMRSRWCCRPRSAGGGDELPGIAFFQGEGQFAERRSAGPDDSADPFLLDLARSTEHPLLGRRTDIIDGQFALVWLTRAECDAGPTPPPPDPRRPGEHVATDEGPGPRSAAPIRS